MSPKTEGCLLLLITYLHANDGVDEEEHSYEENGCLLLLITYLHANDGVDEEEHGYEENDVRQSLQHNVQL